MYDITFIFEEPGISTVELRTQQSGQTLLEVALANDIALHHNCGGVCSCTTCHVYVEAGMEHLDEMSRREKDFLQRAANPAPNSRLGCQSLLMEGEGRVVVKVPDQSRLPDEFYGFE